MAKELFNQPLITGTDVPQDTDRIALGQPSVQGGKNITWDKLKNSIGGGTTEETTTTTPSTETLSGIAANQKIANIEFVNTIHALGQAIDRIASASANVISSPLSQGIDTTENLLTIDQNLPPTDTDLIDVDPITNSITMKAAGRYQYLSRFVINNTSQNTDHSVIVRTRNLVDDAIITERTITLQKKMETADFTSIPFELPEGGEPLTIYITIEGSDLTDLSLTSFTTTLSIGGVAGGAIPDPLVLKSIATTEQLQSVQQAHNSGLHSYFANYSAVGTLGSTSLPLKTEKLNKSTSISTAITTNQTDIDLNITVPNDINYGSVEAFMHIENSSQVDQVVRFRVLIDGAEYGNPFSRTFASGVSSFNFVEAITETIPSGKYVQVVANASVNGVVSIFGIIPTTEITVTGLTLDGDFIKQSDIDNAMSNNVFRGRRLDAGANNNVPDIWYKVATYDMSAYQFSEYKFKLAVLGDPVGGGTDYNVSMQVGRNPSFNISMYMYGVDFNTHDWGYILTGEEISIYFKNGLQYTSAFASTVQAYNDQVTVTLHDPNGAGFIGTTEPVGLIKAERRSSGGDITVNRASYAVATNILDIDFNGKNQAIGTSITQITADVLFKTSNSASAEFANFNALVFNTVVISFDTAYTDTLVSGSDGTWNSGNNTLTIVGNGDMYEVSCKIIGTVRSWIVKKYEA